MTINVKDSNSEVINIKMLSETPKELVAVGQIKLVNVSFVGGKLENVPLVSKTGQQIGQLNF